MLEKNFFTIMVIAVRLHSSLILGWPRSYFDKIVGAIFWQLRRLTSFKCCFQTSFLEHIHLYEITTKKLYYAMGLTKTSLFGYEDQIFYLTCMKVLTSLKVIRVKRCLA